MLKERLSLIIDFSLRGSIGYLRASSHTRLGARDHYTSIIGGKGGAAPSLLHTTLEGATEYTSECKMDVKSK